MNSLGTAAMSGVFVSSIPEPKKRQPKAEDSSYRSEARGREQISRSFCSSPGVSFPVRRRSPERPAEPPAPQARRPGVVRQQSGLMPCHSPRSPTMAPASQSTSPRSLTRSLTMAAPVSQSTRIPRPSRRDRTESSEEATKTISAIDVALRAVEAVEALRADEAMKSTLASGELSPSVNEDLESLCGTECTESTACSLSPSEDYRLDSSRMSFSLRDARRTLKERIGAQERSMRFNNGLLAKLDELRDAVAEEGTKTTTSRKR